MNDKKLKDMWNKAETLMEASAYESSSIEQFISGRSNDTTQKIRNMIIFDLVLKALALCALAIDFVLYFGTTNVMSVTVAGVAILIPLIFMQYKLLNRFSEAADNGQTTRNKLASMLTYLKTKFFTTLLSVSGTYLFVFIAGSLLYFYAAYGYVRPLDGVDFVVFLTFIILGIVLNFVVNHGQVKYHIKHLEICLNDLNDQNLKLVSENIELQRKRDRANKLLLALVLVLGILLLIIVFKNIGFIAK
ncbi:hypothetical protein SAMN05444285_11254 [Draconibacterium orientale]|jgi:hypothetical protein|uniref:Uncharacterized protein n=1 Tax=Draconibacterium orientale TaxID=1168034 RepID=X5DL16_9BACT|nr:hypothetical protein [Draconibacterium orientale]AHW61919.1 hypothetical protein FH5T_11065 [Draconibacterium orientale]SET40523.1 hypothetical protein SAMN05444285_11254 [Draconibacterium orientale]